jgi:hypothetical protein
MTCIIVATWAIYWFTTYPMFMQLFLISPSWMPHTILIPTERLPCKKSSIRHPSYFFFEGKKCMDDKKESLGHHLCLFQGMMQPKKLNTHLSSQENHTFLKHLTSSMLSSFLSILHKVHTQERINYFFKVLSVDLKLKFTNVSCRYSCWTLCIIFTMARQLRKHLGSSSSLEWNSENLKLTWTLKIGSFCNCTLPYLLTKSFM